MQKFLTISGKQIPVVGLGTWNMVGKHCMESVRSALNNGYRHIDTAQMYHNEKEVGEAIKQSGVPREEIFVTTKLAPARLRPDLIEDAVNESLNKLQTGYIDLLLIHWPVPRMDMRGCLDEMTGLTYTGIVKNIGVSNFSAELFSEALRIAPVICNQIELTPYHYDNENIQTAKNHDIMITAYSPLVKGFIKNDFILKEIGKRHNKSAAQTALRWLVQLGNVSVIPKASNEKHQRENLEIFDFSLSKIEMGEIAALNTVGLG
jgi:2,5-diketo-D-gluconate reductase B